MCNNMPNDNNKTILKLPLNCVCKVYGVCKDMYCKNVAAVAVMNSKKYGFELNYIPVTKKQKNL